MNNLTIVILLVVLLIIFNMNKKEGFDTASVEATCDAGFIGIGYSDKEKKDCHGEIVVGKQEYKNGKMCSTGYTCSRGCCDLTNEKKVPNCPSNMILSYNMKCCPINEPNYIKRTKMCTK